MIVMSGIKFELKPVDKKPVRKSKTVKRSRRRSKYDPLIDRFMSEEHDLVRVDVEKRKANYLRNYLDKIIKSRGLEDRLVPSVVGGELFLEKVKVQ